MTTKSELEWAKQALDLEIARKEIIELKKTISQLEQSLYSTQNRIAELEAEAYAKKG
jgi:hypothetical protein